MTKPAPKTYDLCESSDDEEDEVVCLGSDRDVIMSENKPAAKKHTHKDTHLDDSEEIEILPHNTTNNNGKTTAMEDDDEVQIVDPTSQPSKALPPASAVPSLHNEVEFVSTKPASSPHRVATRHATRQFECSICLDDTVEMPKGYSLESCRHRFCVECLGNLIQSFMKSASAESTRVRCPAEQCQTDLTLNDIRYIYRDNPEGWKAFTDRANVALLEHEIALGNGSTRRCPAERCNFTFCFEPSNNPDHLGTAFDCPVCQASFCLNCKANGGAVGPAHKNMNCHERQLQLERQADERRKFKQWKIQNAQADARFQQLLEKEAKAGTTKPCPKCHTMVTKNGGCDHMSCSRCRHEYYWSTGKPYGRR